MNDSVQSVAFVGVAGGAGTTRLTVEAAAMLARDGRDVAVFDAAFATQGLAQYVHGRIETDVTRLLTDESVAPSEAFVDLDVDADGRVAVCPAYASFAGLAAAKTAEACERFGDLLRETASVFDAVLVDAPPVGDNPSVAAVTATDRTALVAPASHRGADALPRARDRLADVDAGVHAVIANRAGDDHPIESATVAVPTSDVVGVSEAPACDGDATGAYQSAVGAVVETAFEVSLDADLEPRGVARKIPGI